MSKQEKLIKEMIPYIWYLFCRYLNDPHYMVQQSDILIKVFMKKTEVSSFIKNINKKLEEIVGTGDFRPITYKEIDDLTYGEVLHQIIYYYGNNKI